MTLPFTQGHNCISDYNSHILDSLASKLGMTVDLCMTYLLMLNLMTLTLMQGHNGSAKATNQCWIILTTKQTVSIKLATTVGHFLRDLDFENVLYGLTILLGVSFKVLFYLFGVCAWTAFSVTDFPWPPCLFFWVFSMKDIKKRRSYFWVCTCTAFSVVSLLLLLRLSVDACCLNCCFDAMLSLCNLNTPTSVIFQPEIACEVSWWRTLSVQHLTPWSWS